MNATLAGLIIYLLLFAAGVYLYLFSRGAIGVGEGEARNRAEAFRTENKTWMRILGLLLAAVMAVNIAFSLAELFGAA